VDVTGVNDPPVVDDQTFAVPENGADGTVVGTVSASDPDAGDTLFYEITAGDPGGTFAVDGATGEITVADASQLDFETAPVFNLTVEVTDSGALTDTATVTIDLTDANDAPVLTPSGPTLPSITEDDTDNAGVRVSSILGSSVSDIDTGAVRGIAITSLSSGNGTWQYRVGAGSWTDMGTVSEDGALLLRAGNRVRFVPDGRNGTVASFDFRAWDRTAGAVATKVDARDGGGSTAFSKVTDTASITVTAVNDAPDLGDAELSAVPGDTASPPGERVVDLFAGSFSDVDLGSGFAGIAVTGNGADPGAEGVWEYSSDDGVNWFAIGPVGDDATALALSADTLLRFVPAADFSGAPSALVVRGLDDSYAGGFSSTAGGSQIRANVDTASSGGTSAIAGRTAEVSTTITWAGPIDISPEDLPDPDDEPGEDPGDGDGSGEDPAFTDETSEPPSVDIGPPDLPSEPHHPRLVIAPDPTERVSIDFSEQHGFKRDARSEALQRELTPIEVVREILMGERLVSPVSSLAELIFQEADFLDELDRLQEDLDRLMGFETAFFGSSIAVTMGLSIGYVIWLTRGGLLIASLLSSVPAWRLIDPVVVLSQFGTSDEEDPDRDESLDSLLSRSSRPEGSRLWIPEPRSAEESRSGLGSPATLPGTERSEVGDETCES
jgi:VCBS repeat-containing protein